MRIVLANLAAMAALAAALLAPSAHADPDCDLYDARLCGDWGKVTYCPDTGTYVSVMSPCPSLITGPYTPGGLEPDD